MMMMCGIIATDGWSKLLSNPNCCHSPAHEAVNHILSEGLQAINKDVLMLLSTGLTVMGVADPFGAGVVIRDYAGNLVTAMYKRLGHGSDHQAEAGAVLLGLHWCITNRFENIHLETDFMLMRLILPEI
ncbi:hypothetical protein HAX54_012898 [Datura stramonium]|uniref:RNase H type-1 domain-containing protein n=1 Tax=Datura stramonium TaxID=4076 RepID=A0ABS8RXR3_DATST|nr:hypothetical protein [Datura stramonium]